MDYYELLGVTPGATSDEIRAAYRKLARRYHPDLNPGDAESEKKFKEITEAYNVLSDADRRRKYDESSDCRKRGSRKGSTRNHRTKVTTKNCARCDGEGEIGVDFGFFVYNILCPIKFDCPECHGTGKEIV
jgi:curved DNA-binding protein CbpA